MSKDVSNLRGKVTLKQKLGFALESSPVVAAVYDAFEGSVGVMHDENHYSAITLANCINDVCLSEDVPEQIEDIIELIDSEYWERVSPKEVSKSKNDLDAKVINAQLKQMTESEEAFANALDNENINKSTRELMEMALKDYRRMNSNEDGLYLIDVIDVTEGLNSDNLSVEGARKHGLIDKSTDTQETDINTIVINDTRLWGKIEIDENGEVVGLMCPVCECKNLYVIRSDFYGCLDCDAEFNVDTISDEKEPCWVDSITSEAIESEKYG